VQINKEFRIDYLQFSTDVMPSWAIDNVVDFYKKSNKQFYKTMTRFSDGALMYAGNPNTEKRLFVLSGSVCDKKQITPEWLKSLIVESAGTVSRIDLAMTTDVNILPMIQKEHRSIISNMFNTVKIISDADYTPQTIYCGDMGKRGKKGIVRAYDKGLQLGLDIQMYRIEYEARGKHADISAKRYANGQSIPSIMNSKFKIDRKWYMDIFGNDESTIRFPSAPDETPEIERKMSWLANQVMPSLQYVVDYDLQNGTQNFKALLDMIKFE